MDKILKFKVIVATAAGISLILGAINHACYAGSQPSAPTRKNPNQRRS